MKERLKQLKKKKYFKLIIFIGVLLFIPIGYTISRYIMNVFKDNFVESNSFYFNSNRLKKENPLYTINNWSGADEFRIDIVLNSYKNNILATQFDVEYEINYTCAVDVICSSNKDTGVIRVATHTDSFSISIVPTRAFEDEESITIHVEATSTKPYIETISADFKIIVGKQGISYEIDDMETRPYLLVLITNAMTTYTVKEAFLDYQVGDIISDSVYRKLENSNKKRCISATIELSFDPNIIVLDTTSSIIKNGVIEEEINIDGNYYVSKISFPIEAMTSMDIRFYKIDHTQNYTYPYENTTSIVSFDAY